MQKEPITTFDENKFEQRLRDVQIPKEQVDAHVENLHELVLILTDENEHVNQKIDGMIKKLDDTLYDTKTTRLDIKEGMAKIHVGMADSRTDIANLRTEVKTDIADSRTDIANLRTDMANLATDSLKNLVGWMIGISLGQLGFIYFLMNMFRK